MGQVGRVVKGCGGREIGRDNGETERETDPPHSPKSFRAAVAPPPYYCWSLNLDRWWEAFSHKNLYANKTFVFQNSESRYDVNINNNNNNNILGDIPRDLLVSWKLLYNFVLKSRKFKSEFSWLSSYLTPLWCAALANSGFNCKFLFLGFWNGKD